MAITAVECPDGVCHSHNGGHAVEREVLRDNLHAHGPTGASAWLNGSMKFLLIAFAKR